MFIKSSILWFSLSNFFLKNWQTSFLLHMFILYNKQFKNKMLNILWLRLFVLNVSIHKPNISRQNSKLDEFVPQINENKSLQIGPTCTHVLGCLLTHFTRCHHFSNIMVVPFQDLIPLWFHVHYLIWRSRTYMLQMREDKRSPDRNS